MAITCRTCGEETRAWWMAQCPRCIANERSVLTSELAAAKEEIARLKANHPERMYMLRAEVAEAALETAERELEAYRQEETCMCGDLIKHHNLGSGHSPVSQLHHHIGCVQEENDALKSSLASERKVTERLRELVAAEKHAGDCWSVKHTASPDAPCTCFKARLKAALHPPQQEEQ